MSSAEDMRHAEIRLDNHPKLSGYGFSSSSPSTARMFLLIPCDRLTSLKESPDIPLRLKALTEKGVLKLVVVDELHLYVLVTYTKYTQLSHCYVAVT